MIGYFFKTSFVALSAILLLSLPNAHALSDADRKSFELTRVDKEAIPFRLEKARSFFIKAERFQKKRKWEDAIQFYKKCISENSGLPEAFHNLGLCYEEQHKLPEALESFKKATNLEGGFRSTYKHIARIYLEMGDHQSAETWLKRYLAS